MGAKTPVTPDYQRFLNTAKANYRAKGEGKNFFDWSNIRLLTTALDTELDATHDQLQKAKNDQVDASDNIVDMASNAFGKLMHKIEKVATKADRSITGDAHSDPALDTLKEIKRLRKEKLVNETTPFLTFAEKCKQAINDYLGQFTRNPQLDPDLFLNQVYNLTTSLLDSLKKYRHKAKSHHYFRPTVGRAEIANKVTGGGLEPWIKNSIKRLTEPGTEVKITNDLKYVCRKATQEEENQHKDNSGRPKFFQYKHIMLELQHIP